MFNPNRTSEPPGTDPTSRKDWIRVFLYTPDAEGERGSVVGDIKLQLALFVLTDRFAEKFGEKLPYNFDPSPSGPRDPEITDSKDALQDDGEIESTHVGDSKEDIDNVEYVLTSKGEKMAEPLYSALSEQEREELRNIKYKFASASTAKFMIYVYGLHPHYFEEGLIAEKMK